MPQSNAGPSPKKAFFASIGLFIVAIIAVVILWAIFDAWLALIVLVGGFVGMFVLAAWALKRLGDESGAPG